jgi:hypothetical protein
MLVQIYFLQSLISVLLATRSDLKLKINKKDIKSY